MEFELAGFLSVVLSLLILEFLLSVDNALVNISIARSLPKGQQQSAVRWGIGLAAGFRVVALIMASFIIKYAWLKVLGALYLLYLMFDHIGKGSHGEHITEKSATYKRVVMRIAFADIVFSIDNVVSAVGISHNLFYIITGVLIGIISILLMSKYIIRIVNKYPHLGMAGYTIVGIIGTTMLLETLAHWHINVYLKFSLIMSIALFTVWYERNAAVRRASNPPLKFMRAIIAFPYRLYYGSRKPL